MENFISKCVGHQFTPILVEQQTILEAVKYPMCLGRNRCNIFSGAILAIQDIEKPIPGNTISRQVKQWLLENERISIQYPKAQPGIPGNEGPDPLARAVRDLEADEETMITGLKEVTDRIQRWGCLLYTSDAADE